jgi:signal transduction histidine kinase
VVAVGIVELDHAWVLTFTMPAVSSRRAIDVLIRFARLVSDASEGAEVLPLLGEALLEHVPAAGCAVVEIAASGEARLAVARGVPPSVHEAVLEADTIGEELGEQLLTEAAGTFTEEQTRPLVAGGNLFGAVVIFFDHARPVTPEGMQLADGLVDLAAIALGNAAALAKLEHSHAELAASQQMLARSEKLRALGQMAAGVSHDLRNILNPLSLHLQFIDRSLDKGKVADAKESCAEMKQVLVRGVQTLERLREYSRQSKESKTELVELDLLVREAAEIARPRMASVGGSGVRIAQDLGGPPSVMAMSGEVVSALVNLLVNAIDAMAGKGGTITLRSGESNGGSFVRVEDDGPGMPKDVEKRVFEPFFTTKGTEGTGLGLAMVYACMQRHGGTVTLATQPGQGTAFTLWFPGGAPSLRAPL